MCISIKSLIQGGQLDKPGLEDPEWNSCARGKKIIVTAKHHNKNHSNHNGQNVLVASLMHDKLLIKCSNCRQKIHQHPYRWGSRNSKHKIDIKNSTQNNSKMCRNCLHSSVEYVQNGYSTHKRSYLACLSSMQTIK